jgi:uncharacterized metal-binding protein
MSCHAGIACGRPLFLRKLKGRRIVVIDLPNRVCKSSFLMNQGLKFYKHYQLKDFGIKKNISSTNDQVDSIVEQIATIWQKARMTNRASYDLNHK